MVPCVVWYQPLPLEWYSFSLFTYLYVAFVFVFLSCHPNPSFHLQTHSEHWGDQDRRGQGQSLGPPLHGEEAAFQTLEAAALRSRANKVSWTTTLHWQQLFHCIWSCSSNLLTFLRLKVYLSALDSFCTCRNVHFESQTVCDEAIYNVFLLELQSIIL